MSDKSLLEYAYEIVSASKDPISFKDLWGRICEEKGLSKEEMEDKVSQFYTNLLLDGRFVNLGDNIWDLRVRHKFDKVHIDMKDAYSEVEVSTGDEEEELEEKEYNEAYTQKQLSREDELEAEESEDDPTPGNDIL